MLFELVDDTTVLRPMPGVVNPRRNLVDDQAIIGDEQLDAEYTDVVERVEDRRCRGYSGGYNIVADRCCLLYTSPSPRDKRQSRMPSSA